MPVPVITQTRSPSVTGDGDDMFCFCWRRLPALRNRFQIGVPASRSRHQSSMVSPSPTLRKIRSFQMIGVEPVHAGISSFQVTLVSVSHSVGRLTSSLTPLRSGPRQVGQLCANAGCVVRSTPPSINVPTSRFRTTTLRR